MTIKKLEKEVRFLKMYAVVITLFLAVLVLAAFKQANQKTEFSEIDVERINIVEKDGKLKMVISNSERQHPGIIDGHTLSRTRPAGMLFFNDMGDECGGLSFSGNQRNGQSSASALLAFDKFRHDQTVAIQYSERNGQYSSGLRVWDRPNTSLGTVIEKLEAIEKMNDGPERAAAIKELQEIPAGAERVMVGRDREQAALVELADAEGKPRIRLSVTAEGAAKVEFLDETGKVTFSLPQDIKTDKKKRTRN